MQSELSRIVVGSKPGSRMIFSSANGVPMVCIAGFNLALSRRAMSRAVSPAATYC